MAIKPSRAVTEARAPGIVEADDATRARWRTLDWYATPPFASRAGAELVRSLDPEARKVWEPACGDGIMGVCLREYFDEVWLSDIAPQCAGATPLDFLNFESDTLYDWLITNPPFEHAEEFVRRGLRLVTRGVAVLCRLSFLESVGRYALHTETPLSALAPFSERVPMQLGPWNPKCSTATAYAWFIYEKGGSGLPVVRLIPPGTRARLSKADDVRRFTQRGEVPLLEHCAL